MSAGWHFAPLSLLIKSWPGTLTPPCAIIFRSVFSWIWLVSGAGMAERNLVILKHVNQTPVLAGCSRCELKFFVPKKLMTEADTART